MGQIKHSCFSLKNTFPSYFLLSTLFSISQHVPQRTQNIFVCSLLLRVIFLFLVIFLGRNQLFLALTKQVSRRLSLERTSLHQSQLLVLNMSVISSRIHKQIKYPEWLHSYVSFRKGKISRAYYLPSSFSSHGLSIPFCFSTS